MFMMTSAPDDDKCDHEAAVSDVICVSVPHVQDGPRDESILATVAPSVGLLSTFQSLQFCVPTYPITGKNYNRKSHRTINKTITYIYAEDRFLT